MGEVFGVLFCIVGLDFAFLFSEFSCCLFFLRCGAMPWWCGGPALPGGAGSSAMLLLLAAVLWRLEPKAAGQVLIVPPLNKLDAGDLRLGSSGCFLGVAASSSLAPPICHRGDGFRVCRRLCSLVAVRKQVSTATLRGSSLFQYPNSTDVTACYFVDLEEDDMHLEMSKSGFCAIVDPPLFEVICHMGGMCYSTKSISLGSYWMQLFGPVCYCWHPTSSCELHFIMPLCHTSIYLPTIGYADYASLLFGTSRRRLRSSLQRFLRFNSKEPLQLSSVKHPTHLQLSSLPRKPLPIQLLVEPLALWLVRVLEAPGKYNCRFCVSEFSTDPLTGSCCAFRHSCRFYPIVHLRCICFVPFYQDDLCNHYVVKRYYQWM